MFAAAKILKSKVKKYKMFYLIFTMFVGIVAGLLLRKVKMLVHIGKAVSFTIYVMLFFLGAKIGADRDILANFSSLGLQAMLLALAGAMGSVFAAALLYRLFFRPQEEMENPARNR